MEIKKIKIGIKSEEQALEEFAVAFKKVQKGENIQKSKGTFFENVKALRSFMTPRRIELIRTIHQKKPASAYELARMVGRDIKSITTDLGILGRIGLVQLEKEAGQTGEKIHPFVDYDTLQVEIAV